MNKKFLKLCLASILSLALNTNLQAQELEQPTSQNQVIGATADIADKIYHFILNVTNNYQNIDATFYNKRMNISFSKRSPWEENDSQDTDEILKSLSEQEWIGSLQELEIHSIPHGIDALLGVLSKTPQLTSLDINFPELEDEYFNTLGAFLPHLSALQKLDFRCSNINESSLIHFVEAFGDETVRIDQESNLRFLNLEYLNLAEMGEEGQLAFAHLLLLLPNLQKLGLNNIKITESVMVNLVNGFRQIDEFELLPNLQQLDLSSMKLIEPAPETQTPEDAEYDVQAFDAFEGATMQMITDFVPAQPSLTTDSKNSDSSEKPLAEMSVNGFQAFAEFLSLMPNLQELNLCNNKFGEQLAALAPAFANMPNLQNLNLASNKITTSAMCNFVNALSEIADFEGLPNLTILNLSTNALRHMVPLGWQALTKFLSCAPNLQELDLSESWMQAPSTQLPEEELQQNYAFLAQILVELSNLKKLKINDGALTEATIIGLASNLPEGEDFMLPNLQVLDWSSNPLETLTLDGCQALARILSCMPNLQTLRLDENHISDGLVAIAPAIAQMHDLDYLDLTGNEMNNSTMVNFVENLFATEGFSGFPKLTTFVIEDTLRDLGEDGGLALGKLLSFMPHLQVLALSENYLGEGFVALAPAIAQMHDLESLTLISVNLDDSTIINFVNTLVETSGFSAFTRMQRLNLHGALQETTEQGWQALMALLSSMPNLELLELGGNSLEEEPASIIEVLSQTDSIAGIPNLTIYGESAASEATHILELKFRDDYWDEPAELQTALDEINPKIMATFG